MSKEINQEKYTKENLIEFLGYLNSRATADEIKKNIKTVENYQQIIADGFTRLSNGDPLDQHGNQRSFVVDSLLCGLTLSDSPKFQALLRLGLDPNFTFFDNGRAVVPIAEAQQKNASKEHMQHNSHNLLSYVVSDRMEVNEKLTLLKRVIVAGADVNKDSRPYEDGYSLQERLDQFTKKEDVNKVKELFRKHQLPEDKLVAEISKKVFKSLAQEKDPKNKFSAMAKTMADEITFLLPVEKAEVIKRINESRDLSQAYQKIENAQNSLSQQVFYQRFFHKVSNLVKDLLHYFGYSAPSEITQARQELKTMVGKYYASEKTSSKQNITGKENVEEQAEGLRTRMACASRSAAVGDGNQNTPDDKKGYSR